MTGSLFVIAGLAALLAGGTALVRPSVARSLLGLKDSEAAAYALRIGGMMLAAFGLALLVLTATAATAGAAR